MRDRPPSSIIPDSPGSYQFKDAQGRIIYVGKAKNLRQRLNSYFADPRTLHPKVAQMVTEAQSLEWIEVRNDLEALMLEFNLIKQHRPRFNIRLRDDKSYPYLAVTTSQEWPRAYVTRGARRRGTVYFGPFGHAYAVRETLDHLIRTLPIRTCSDSKFELHKKQKRPCLLFHIEKCSGPCVGEIEPDDYASLVEEISSFLAGDTLPTRNKLEQAMRDAARGEEFEMAARLRDRLEAFDKATATQQIVGDDNEFVDVIGEHGDELESSVQVLFVRRGRIVGRKGFVVDKVEQSTPAELAEVLLERVYADAPANDLPKEILMNVAPEAKGLYEEFLTEMRSSWYLSDPPDPHQNSAPNSPTQWLDSVRPAHSMWIPKELDKRTAKAKVKIAEPSRGNRRRLLDLANQNAKEEFTRHRLRRASDHDSRARALRELQEHLGLAIPPLRIECFDMSHIQGTDYVGSMVVFEDGLPKKSDYRRFKVKDVPGNDDFAAMREVLRRRLGRLNQPEQDSAAEPNLKPDSKKPVGRFAYRPSLLVVDGGKGQLSVAVEVAQELGITDIELASLAKQFEEVFRPGVATPYLLPRSSEALYLLQRIRDEAHRFAITFHRELRHKRMTKSTLDEVPGLGPARKARLLKHLKSIKNIKAASLDELLSITWLPSEVANALYSTLHPEEDKTDDPGQVGSSKSHPTGESQ